MPLKFKKSDGTCTASDREVLEMSYPHFYAIFNRETKVDWDFINNIAHRPILYEVRGLMTFDDLEECNRRLQWHKAGGSNEASTDAIKAFSYERELRLLKLTNDWSRDPNLTY